MTHLAPGAQMSLLDPRGQDGRHEASRRAGRPSVSQRQAGNRLPRSPLRGGAKSGPLTVLSTRPAPPSTDIYNQQIPSERLRLPENPRRHQAGHQRAPPGGRDERLAGRRLLRRAPAGPTPTLIEYSGYGYADPAGPQSGIAILANLMGFTVVDVNMRGTGCSGGAFDFFEPLQNLDGYDVIETIARQPWVLHHKVGMMGISYGGISQLFTAQTNPPSLAAISPLSVIDATQTTLYPGGILNTGFAVELGQGASPRRQAGGTQRRDSPGPTSGSRRATRPARPTRPCTARRRTSWPRSGPTTTTCRRSPTRWRRSRSSTRSRCRCIMACQWTDEQTGGHCPTLAEHFTGTQRKWFTFTNGTHVDSLDPETFNRWYDFLQLYVAKQAPITNSAAIQAAAPVIYQEAMGISGVTMPPDPIQQQPTYAGAKAAFEQLKPIRILFDNGAGGSEPGQPQPGFEQSFASFPIPGTTARFWYLSAGGALARPAARQRGGRFVQLGRPRPAADQLHGRHGRRHGRPVDRDAALRLAAAARRQRGVLPDQPAERQHDRDRRRRRARLGPLLDSERRPPGHDHRGQARRQGDLRAGRLGAGQRAQARRSEEHAARARPEPPGRPTYRRCRATASSRSRSRSTTRGTPTAPARASA